MVIWAGQNWLKENVHHVSVVNHKAFLAHHFEQGQTQLIDALNFKTPIFPWFIIIFPVFPHWHGHFRWKFPGCSAARVLPRLNPGFPWQVEWEIRRRPHPELGDHRSLFIMGYHCARWKHAMTMMTPLFVLHLEIYVSYCIMYEKLHMLHGI